jgi:hypothetical protein
MTISRDIVVESGTDSGPLLFSPLQDKDPLNNMVDIDSPNENGKYNRFFHRRHFS